MTDQTTAFVYTMSRVGRVGAWSRYVFPFRIDATTQLGTDIYFRSGDTVYKLDTAALADETVGDEGTPFDAVIQWPWLDMGQPGRTKSLVGFDVSGSGNCDVSFGYMEGSPLMFTAPISIQLDTLPGGIIPFPVAGPSLSVKMTFEGPQAWEWDAFNLYFQDFRWTA